MSFRPFDLNNLNLKGVILNKQRFSYPDLERRKQKVSIRSKENVEIDEEAKSKVNDVKYSSQFDGRLAWAFKGPFCKLSSKRL